ncbi:MAG TPA: AAA family ATPase [Candidatus Saccharimonadales bacterium]|nr:AAA family ATPase [Candidatus Saccharimonadales bacterium]
MASNRLIAVVGMPFSGKGEVVSYLVEYMRFEKVYFGGTVLRVLDEKGLPHTQEHEKPLREQLRRDHGPAAMALLNLEEIEAKLKLGDTVIDGLYSWAEYLFLKERFPQMIVMAVWAPPELRYDRAAKRPDRALSREDAIARDHAQLENLQTGGPIAMADVVVNNTGELANLHQFLKCWATDNWEVIQFYR